MRITPWKSQKMVAITFPADETIFVFVGVDLPGKVHCFDCSLVSEIRDVSNWSEKIKAPLVKLYGLDGLQKMWNGWCDALADIFQRSGRDICKEDAEKIQSPTFILHGDKDPLVLPEHPLFLLDKIKGSKLHQFPDGKHNIHLRYSGEFNSLATRFLLE